MEGSKERATASESEKEKEEADSEWEQKVNGRRRISQKKIRFSKDRIKHNKKLSLWLSVSMSAW